MDRDRLRLHFHLVDDLGHVLADEDYWVVDDHGYLINPEGMAERHTELVARATAAGRTTTLTVTDPAGDIPATVVYCCEWKGDPDGGQT